MAQPDFEKGLESEPHESAKYSSKEGETKSLKSQVDKGNVNKSLAENTPLTGCCNESSDDQVINTESECPNAGELETKNYCQPLLSSTPQLIIALCSDHKQSSVEGKQTELPGVESEAKVTGEEESVESTVFEVGGNDCLVQFCSQTCLSVQEINDSHVPGADADSTRVLSAGSPCWREKSRSGCEDIESALPLKRGLTTSPVASREKVSCDSDDTIPQMNSIEDQGNAGHEVNNSHSL